MLHGIFELAEQYNNVLKSQYQDKLHFVDYSNFNMRLNHNVDMITSLNNMLAVVTVAAPSGQEGIQGVRSQLKAIATHQALFVHCSVFLYFYVWPRCIYTPSAGLAHRGRRLLSFD